MRLLSVLAPGLRKRAVPELAAPHGGTLARASPGPAPQGARVVLASALEARLQEPKCASAPPRSPPQVRAGRHFAEGSLLRSDPLVTRLAWRAVLPGATSRVPSGQTSRRLT